MPSVRLLALLVGLSIVLILAIWLVSALYQLYISIAATSPWLANLILVALMLLLGAIFSASIYVVTQIFSQRSRRPKKRRLPKAPEQKTEAAGETLRAVRKQVSQIQDRVAQQALLERSRAIEANLTRQEVRVVIFGTGSAGKTSLINALVGRIVGETSAPMGTTQTGETYSLQLNGLDRQILITDTPGILEAGVAGTEREQKARQLAADADLLLFVVDNDLRQSEYDPLRMLAEIGKRSLLVFNKTDLYSEQDKETILARLRSRLQDLIAPQDVIAVAANPQPIPLPNGEIVRPDPDIMPLIQRLAAVLRDEGQDLVADNILLQSQRLGEEARRLIDQQRRQQADKIIDRYQWIGAGAVAVTPLPVVDMLAAAAVNAQMVVEIGRVYGCDLNLDRGRDLAISLGRTLVSLGIVKGAVELISRALQLTIATYLVGKAIQGVTTAYLTRIAGKSFVEYFRHDQDWGDGGMTEVVQRQFKLVQREEFLKAFVQDAIRRVVQPLTEHNQDTDEEIQEEEALETPDPPEYVVDDWQERSRNWDEW